MVKHVDKEVLNAVCKRTMSMTREELCYWDWTMGVALYGLIKIYQRTGDETCYDYVKKFVDDGLKAYDEIPKRINTVLPFLSALFVYEKTGEEYYADYCRETAQWLMNDASRLKNGGWAHSALQGMFDTELWVDTLYMAGIFMAEAGMKLKNEKYVAEVWKQLRIHFQCIQAENGLFCHGYSEQTKDNMSAVLWGRGNAWITACVPEICELVGNADEEVVKGFQKQVEALVRVQDESGLWHTVLDAPESYCEVSASAGIVCGMLQGMRLGLLPKEYMESAKRGYDAVIKKIAPDGVVTGVSQGTGIRDTKESYMTVPTKKIMTWGQGLVLLMIAEAELCDLTVH